MFRRGDDAAAEALTAQLDPLEAIENGLAKGLREVGRRFEYGEMFLMQLILSGEAMKAGVEIMKPEILRQRKQLKGSGTFLIRTVEGDLHDIGKSIVSAMLTAEGFDVVDVRLAKDEPFTQRIVWRDQELVSARNPSAALDLRDDRFEVTDCRLIDYSTSKSGSENTFNGKRFA